MLTSGRATGGIRREMPLAVSHVFRLSLLKREICDSSPPIVVPVPIYTAQPCGCTHTTQEAATRTSRECMQVHCKLCRPPLSHWSWPCQWRKLQLRTVCMWCGCHMAGVLYLQPCWRQTVYIHWDNMYMKDALFVKRANWCIVGADGSDSDALHMITSGRPSSQGMPGYLH